MMNRIIRVIILIMVLGLVGIYIGLRIRIKSDIDKICTNAMSHYQGDKIEALISV